MRSEVVAIDRNAKRVTVRPTDGGAEYALGYDELVLAPGASPRLPGHVAPDAPLHALRTLDDLDAIMAAAASLPRGPPSSSSAAATSASRWRDNLRRREFATTIVQRGTRLLGALDPEMAAPLADHVEAQGVTLRFGRSVTRVDERGVVLDDGDRLDAHLVIAAMGVEPESRLAHDAGLEIGESGGIVVDDAHRTSDPAVFAVGDVAEKRDAVDGGHRVVPLAGLANRHGRAVADAIAG